MSKTTLGKILMAAVLITGSAAVSHAQTQDGAYSGYTPYSVYGLGDISSHGSAYNRSMGGVGIASRNHRFINTMNPAAVTARDSLAFMADLSISGEDRIYRQGSMADQNTIFNISDIVLTFPLYKSSAFMIGIAPFSSMGYYFASTNSGFLTTSDEEYKKVIADAKSLGYSASGQGSVYQVYLGAGATFWNRLSVGAQVIEYFGEIDKSTTTAFGEASYYSISEGTTMNVFGTGGKFGLQYEQPIGDCTIGLGATYKMKTNLSGNIANYGYRSGSQTDTTRYSSGKLQSYSDRVNIASEKGVGLSIAYADKWRAEVDYLRSDWTGSNFDTTDGFGVAGESTFRSTLSQSVRAGFELTPNRNDIRYYYKRISYRGGAYWDRSYFQVDGNYIDSYGISIGATIPVYKWYNGITVEFDLGQRASTANNLVRERYLGFSVGFNVFDIWFQKQFYD